jgi:hypothetical protein
MIDSVAAGMTVPNQTMPEIACVSRSCLKLCEQAVCAAAGVTA